MGRAQRAAAQRGTSTPRDRLRPSPLDLQAARRAAPERAPLVPGPTAPRAHATDGAMPPHPYHAHSGHSANGSASTARQMRAARNPRRERDEQHTCGGPPRALLVCFILVMRAIHFRPPSGSSDRGTGDRSDHVHTGGVAGAVQGPHCPTRAARWSEVDSPFGHYAANGGERKQGRSFGVHERSEEDSVRHVVVARLVRGPIPDQAGGRIRGMVRGRDPPRVRRWRECETDGDRQPYQRRS